MEKKKRGAKKYLAIAVALMLVSMIAVSIIQTNGGSITIKDIRFETTNGLLMSGLLLIPENATADTPSPAIVVSHGMYNNREMQDANYVELARRGYVVFSMDMYSHGNSDNTDSVGVVLVGMYEAVKMLDSLGYVDSSKIGITGHSMGGMSSNMAVTLDNMAEERLVSAVLLNCANATYTDSDGAFSNIYGSRDVGIIAAQYDEFFFKDVDENGETTAARDFIAYNNAQSFLHHGDDPNGQELRQSYTQYAEEIDGEEAFRVIYTPEIIHPWSHFSQRSTEATIDFFEEALGAPNPIDAGSQVWQWKEFFGFVGLVGVAMFIVSFAILMVFTPFFSSLRAKEVVMITPLQKGRKAWFWGGLVAGALFGAVTYFPIQGASSAMTTAYTGFAQSSPWGVSLWAALCGAFSILVMAISYYASKKSSAISLTERGVALSLPKLGKTILLAIIVVAAAYAWVFFADYFFKADFRIWTIGMKAFEADKIFQALYPCVPLFLVYYVANSVAVNSFNFCGIGKREWGNTLVVAVFNVLPAIILLALQYINFVSTGFLMFPSYNMPTMWLFPMLVFLPVTGIMARKIYKVTNNPYLPGIINGLIVAMISCSNTLTWG